MFILSFNKMRAKGKTVLLGTEGMGARGRGWGKGREQEEGWSNDPIIVCTYE
jgi:hypothetical protein